MTNLKTKKIKSNTNTHNQNIIHIFEQLIDSLIKYNKIESDKDKKKVNGFRIKNLKHSLSTISTLDYDITLDNITSLNLPGIGKGTINRIKEILSTNNLSELDDIKINIQNANTNIGLIDELNNVIGIGDKKAIEIINKFKIKSVDEFKKKVETGKIEVNDKIKLGLKYYGKYQTNIPRDEINRIYIYLDQIIRKLDKKLLFYICGSYRRGKSTSGDIDILLLNEDVYFQEEVAETDHLAKVVNFLKKKSFLLDDLTGYEGGTKYMGFCKYLNNPVRRIDIRMIGIESFIPALVYFTGSYELNQKMRKLAKDQGYKLNEYGLYLSADDKMHIISEQQLFEKLGMEYLEPEERSI